MSIRLGVNVDHVATLRQARGTIYPSPVKAALLAEQSGADLITVHLREDRRHIQERDVEQLKELLTVPLNLEMANTSEMLAFALKVRPAWCCIVPEKREELTTEGGLDVVKHHEALKNTITDLQNHGVKVSLFVEANTDQIHMCKELNVDAIELHTGEYAEQQTEESWMKLAEAAALAAELDIHVHAGHGLHYHNIHKVLDIPEIEEFNIGHAIVAQSVFTGLEQAIRDMKGLFV